MFKKKSISTVSQGASFELKARQFLEKKGFHFIAANQWYRCGEIDLIMKDKDTLVFVEVRQRKCHQFGSALESISLKKQQRLLKAANLWLVQYDLSLDSADCRFDAVVFEGVAQKLVWHPNFMELMG